MQLFTTRYAASRTVGLHTEEQLWFDSPARLGDTVTLEGTYVESYTRRGQDYVVMEARATGPDGRVILRHRGVEILRTRPGSVAGRAQGGDGGADRVDGTFDPELPTARVGTPSLVPGRPCPPRRSPSPRSRRRSSPAPGSTCATCTTTSASPATAGCVSPSCRASSSAGWSPARSPGSSAPLPHRRLAPREVRPARRGLRTARRRRRGEDRHRHRGRRQGRRDRGVGAPRRRSAQHGRLGVLHRTDDGRPV
ncbi:hypothetical protein NKH77_46920 [Streptomyces sp. M19]